MRANGKLARGFIISIFGGKNEYQLFEIVKSTASRLGFDYCAYGMQSPLSIAEPKQLC